ncbi:MAG: helix-turn-helix domain-containing protein [Ruminococcus sp.]|nr:helix-turn-helix domain-containing protein [Ruminococcus sp.]
MFKIMRNFGDYLKQKRTEAELTQENLAEMMSVSQNAVQNWESGRTRIMKNRLTKLAECLKIEFDKLEAAYNDDGEDYPDFPSFMFSDEQNETISSLHLTPEHKELIMLLKIYNAENWDRRSNKPRYWYEWIMLSLRKIPYKYTESKGVYRVYEMGLQVDKFFKYVPADFCFEMIRNSPDTDFDIRKLNKKDILKWMDYRVFNSNNSKTPYEHHIEYSTYSSIARSISSFKEDIIRNDYSNSGFRFNDIYAECGITERVYNSQNKTYNVRLTEKGSLFQEWCRDIVW